MRKKKGAALIVLVIIIVLVVIVVAGLTAFVFEGLRLSIFKEQELKTIYLAQAGIMAAIIDYRDGDSWGKATNVNVAGNQYYHVGKDANFLWIDPSSPQVSGKTLKRIAIKNINSSASITVTSLVVDWTFGGSITEVTLGNTSVWSGTASSGSTLDITDFTISAGTTHSGNNDQKWTFSDNVSGTVACTFIFSDGSERKALLLNSGAGANKEFSITATGQVNGNATWRRTVEATYDTGTSTITSWQETPEHIIP
jgi:hypothetical protein